ncbi:ABC transporter ATP-binding protein [Spirochaeta isovalerica]|uniref:ABC-2 type transport system ATP-binding protein n=1 Tax=Spirochaeta isovalerica TaxID=150 RepID=A0A841RC58_9SPIO|nr:ABC transporter ATP-binding protein [Spirochaeta isovalerica]MBB6480961.1 ABC-2 type transport system ATP-binding protein [Spirochaeta isovalerica]
MEDSPVLETESLTKSYGKSRGIIDVNLSVSRGEIFGFIGPNGAGKSTTIRTILGLLFPDSGHVRLFGENALSSGDFLRQRIGFVPSELNYYDGLKTGQLLDYSARLFKVKDKSIITRFCERLDLDTNRSIKDLSLGNRKKVAIIQALLHRPELLILDEPTSGLDPLMQSRFYEILREEQERGATIFFSSHTLSEVERLCSRVAIIKEGKIIKNSGMEELKQLYLKRFRLIFPRGTSFSAEELEKAAPGVLQLSLNKRGAEGLYKGNVRDLMKNLSQLPLEDAVLEDPGLEEIFMHYYNGKEDTV